MKSLSSHINEMLIVETKVGRAWSGKINRLDDLMGWLYEKNIFSAKDKTKKDNLFRQYYRWYNDGDFPACARAAGVSRHSGDKAVETVLEQKIDAFIKDVLSRYAGKYDRSKFHADTLIKELERIKNVLGQNEIESFLTYWSDKTAVNDTDYQTKLIELKQLFINFDTLSKAVCTNSTFAQPWQNPAKEPIRARKTSMQKYNVWNHELDVDYDAIVDISHKLIQIIDNLVIATKRLHETENL